MTSRHARHRLASSVALLALALGLVVQMTLTGLVLLDHPGAGLRLAIERSTQGRAIHVDLYRRWSGGRMLAPGWALTVSTDLVQRAYVTAAEPVPTLGLWP